MQRVLMQSSNALRAAARGEYVRALAIVYTFLSPETRRTHRSSFLSLAQTIVHAVHRRQCVHSHAYKCWKARKEFTIYERENENIHVARDMLLVSLSNSFR